MRWVCHWTLAQVKDGKNRVRTLERELERVQLTLPSQARLSADTEPVGTVLTPDSRDESCGI